jgi:hypothetical protein
MLYSNNEAKLNTFLAVIELYKFLIQNKLKFSIQITLSYAGQTPIHWVVRHPCVVHILLT